MAYDISMLLSYSQGLVGDWAQRNAIAKWLVPEVQVTTKKVYYKIYDAGDAFQVIDTRRAIGGSASRTDLKVTDANIILDENAFETAIDDQERRDVPETGAVLETIKIRNLTLKVLNNYLRQVFAFLYGNITVTAAYGNWSLATVDPILEIDTLTQVMTDVTGIAPNKLYLDLSSWIKLKNNKLVLDRIRFMKAPSATADIVNGLFAVPLDIKIGGGAKYSGTSSNNALLFYSQDSTSQEDPSLAKCFTLNENRFNNLTTYREEKISSDVYRLAWQQDLVLTGPAMGVRLTIT